MTSSFDLFTEGPLPSAARFSTQSYFQRLGLEPAFDVDLGSLERAFLERSRRVHPDFHSGAGPRERIKAVGLSAAINEAYRALKDPVLRAEYLLEQLGGASSSDDKRTPAGFLIEVMELRERLEDALTGDDTASLTELVAELRPKRRETLDRVSEELRCAEPRLGLVRERLNCLKYYDNAIGEATSAL